ncbi:MAG TPA: hypothetical protein PKE55_09185 [Kiritimatiellia bacterium]|nr:hypothetical protein [Kiritimatiellia bacterium]
MSESLIHFTCAACRGRLAVEGSKAGRAMACPGCGSGVKVPKASTALPPALALGLLHGGVFAGVLCAGLFAAWVLLAARHPPQVGEAVSPVVARVSMEVHPLRQSPVFVASERRAEASAEGETWERGGDAWLREESPGVDAARLAEAEARYEALVQWLLENVRGRYPVPERLVNRLNVNPVSEDFGMSEDLQELLRLEPDRRVLVDEVLRYTKAVLGELERSQLEVASVSADQVTLYIPPYPELGRVAKEDLYHGLEVAMGPVKFDRMLDVSEASLRGQYHHFGEAERLLTFQLMVPESGSVNPYVLIRDEWVTSEGPSVRRTEVVETAVVEIPAPYQAYTPWLPPALSVFATP